MPLQNRNHRVEVVIRHVLQEFGESVSRRSNFNALSGLAERPISEPAGRLHPVGSPRIRWRDIDFETRQIRVVDSKTKAGERIVPMFASARKVLLEQKARSRFKRPTTSSSAPHSARPSARTAG